jgi:sensor domain CHASE-containing protein
MLVSIFAMNVVFRMFFSLYLEEQEDAQMRSIGNGVYTYFSSMLDAQLGNANDWSHWNDTYEFVKGEFPKYQEDNLNPDTIKNISASFIIYLLGDSIYNKQYFDLEQEQFTDFRAGFDKDFDRVAEVLGKVKTLRAYSRSETAFILCPLRT